MSYIFLDESGDLGFGEKSSKWFILTIVFTNNHRCVEKCVKRIHRGLKKKYKKVSELHAYHCDAITKKRVLKLLAQAQDLKILSVVLNKKKFTLICKIKKTICIIIQQTFCLIGCQARMF